MKKLISIILSLLTVISLIPFTYVPVSAAETCTCTTKCTEGSVNSECAVCFANGGEPGTCTGGYTYDEATNTYTVHTADGLFAVAELVNGGEYSINITLAEDIVLNENLADKVTVAEDGTLTVDASVRTWTPIGEKKVKTYNGTFDGGNHTITGLYSVITGSGYSGLIGFLAEGATVKNVKIHDFRLDGRSGGTVVGYNRGEVSGCSISGSGIFGGVVDIPTYAGGIVAYNYGTVENCSSSADLYFKGTGNFGGIVGTANSGSSVTGCYSSGTMEAECVDTLNVGGIVGNADGDITDCHNSGSLKAKHAVSESNVNVYVGGIAGESSGNITCCSNSGSVETVKVSAAVSSEVNAGGIAGNLYNGTVFGCYNSGSLSGEGTSLSVGGIAGDCSDGTVSGCYNIGSIDSGTYSGGIVAIAYYGTYADCYYLDTCVKSGSTEQSSANGITEKTADQFASGEVAYLLNGDQSTITFKQTLGTDAYPGFTGGTVYQVENCKEEPVYSNTNENIGHQWVNGTCTVCDLDCAHSGGTTKPTDNGNGTHSFTCAVCGDATEAHSFDENGTCVCGVNLFDDRDSTLTIDGTLGGKTEATEEDITVLVNKIKEYVDSGITTIIVTGSEPAMIDMVSWTNTAIGEAIYRLSGSDDYNENNPYNGKIDLILQDVTEIVDQEFYSAWALNSITLPKVIKIGDEAFHRTWFLKTITFESVLTEVNETGGVMFAGVGEEVGGCDLILNCGQMNESSVPTPDLTTNTWKFRYENEFKSITLTHSYGDWVSNGDGTHKRTCANDSTHTENGDCSGGTATCTTPAVCDTCGVSYGEVDKTNHDSSVECVNGFCPNGCYEPATLNAEGFYEIFNAGQLYWFARQVNIEGNTAANGKLMADIDLENRTWYPIGLYDDIAEANGSLVQKQYVGTFDGNNHTVSNFIAIGNGSQGLFGYCNYSSAQIKNLGVINATVSGWNAGAVAGYCANLTNCYAVGCTITGASDTNTQAVTISSVGGNNGPTSIVNCWAYDCELIVGEGETSYVMHPVGGIRASNDSVNIVQNCYYGEIVTDAEFTSTTGATEKTEAQFASGEVAYLLGTAWGQTIGTDSYPVLGGKTVYEIKVCEKSAYSNNEEDVPHDYDENGFCTVTTGETHYQPAPDSNSDGFFEIGNAGQLFWFAQQVNVEGNREIKGVLTANIDLENKPWTPIGSTGEENNNFRGVFDGQNYTIRGLNVEGSENGVGFFGEVRTGTVKNFTIYGEVVVNTEVNYVGGVIGSICGVNGETDLERNGAVIQNITSFVNVTAKAHGIGMIGGFVGYANHQSLIEQCAWYGTFDAGIYRVDSGAGGFIGKIQENTSEVTIRNCAAYGTIKTGYAGDYNNTATIYMGGFLSFSNTNAKTTLENCLFAGRFERGENLTDQAFLGAFGTLRSVNAIKNCYYLGDDGLEAVHSDSNLKPGSDNVEITSVTEDDLRNNTIATQLGDLWSQGEHYPVLKRDGGEHSYTYADNGDGTHNKVCSECGYVAASEAHSGGTATCTEQAECRHCGVSYGEVDKNNHDETVAYENGFCPNGCYEPAELVGSYYQITNAGQLYWFAQQVNSGNTNINGELKANIVVNENVLTADGEPNGDGSEFRIWTPIGTPDNGYSGDFCGLEHTVSGLYFNDSNAGCVGLFGYVGSGTVNHVGVIDSYFNGSVAVGGVVGCNNGTVEYAYNTGTVKGSQCVGGVVGDNLSTVNHAYNTGTVSGDFWVGGVVGSNQSTVMYAYNTGSVSGAEYVGGVAGDNYDTSATVTNCYFDSTVYTGNAIGADSGTATDVEGKTTEQFASGEVAYLLGRPFGQTIGTNSLPVLYGETVYAVHNCKNEVTYSNTNENLDHNYVNGVCTVCGAADPDYTEPEFILGDVNGDVTINGKDSNQLKQLISGAAMPSEEEKLSADVNGDGALNGIDANILAQFLSGAIGGF